MDQWIKLLNSLSLDTLNIWFLFSKIKKLLISKRFKNESDLYLIGAYIFHLGLVNISIHEFLNLDPTRDITEFLINIFKEMAHKSDEGMHLSSDKLLPMTIDSLPEYYDYALIQRKLKIINSILEENASEGIKLFSITMIFSAVTHKLEAQKEKIDKKPPEPFSDKSNLILARINKDKITICYSASLYQQMFMPHGDLKPLEIFNAYKELLEKTIQLEMEKASIGSKYFYGPMTFFKDFKSIIYDYYQKEKILMTFLEKNAELKSAIENYSYTHSLLKLKDQLQDQMSNSSYDINSFWQQSYKNLISEIKETLDIDLEIKPF